MIFRRQCLAQAAAEMRAAAPHIDDDVEHRTGQNQLSLTARFLKMQPAQNAAVRAGQIVLIELCGNSSVGVTLAPPYFLKGTARVRVYIRFDQQHAGQFGCDEIHRVNPPLRR